MMSSQKISLAAVALGLTLASPAHAQESQLFTWTGRVDRDVRLTVQPNNVSNTTEASMQSRARVRVNTRLPQQDGVLRVATGRGRGQVVVSQQPNASNGYTALIDIADPQSGAEMYSITAYFTPTSQRVVGNRGRRGRDRQQEVGGEYVGNAPVLHWSGDVNKSVDLVWREGTVTQRTMRGASVRNVSSSMSGNRAGTQNGTVSVNLRDGRGRAEVVQQPNAENRYTTIIRILDPAGGFGRYSLDAVWR